MYIKDFTINHELNDYITGVNVEFYYNYGFCVSRLNVDYSFENAHRNILGDISNLAFEIENAEIKWQVKSENDFCEKLEVKEFWYKDGEAIITLEAV